MARRERRFEARSPAEREWVLGHTWCPHCEEADLGMTDPAEYEDGGRVYVEGRCRRCGGRVVTAITETAAELGAQADPRPPLLDQAS